MTYKVINRFFDKEDKNRVYNVGDEYPRAGLKPTKKRIEELSKKHPDHGIVFIEEDKPKGKSKDKE